MKKLLSLLLVAVMCASMFCVMAEEPKKAFSDVDASTAIGQAIEVLASAGILSGDGDGKFRPNDGLSRAELCKIVNMIFKYTEKDTIGFSDVPAEAWYHDQVLIAKKAGYIKGYEDGTFRANNKVTREQACVILARVTGLKDNGVAVEITDEVAAWALPSVKLVVAHKLMALEEGNTFRATQNITRGEFSQTHAGFVKSSGSTPNTPVISGGNSGLSNSSSSGNNSSSNNSSGNNQTQNPGNNSTPTPTPEPTPEPDYEAENAEMVYRINEVSEAIDNYYVEFTDNQLDNIIDPILFCLTGALEDANSNIITNQFIRKKYKSTIDDLSAYIDTQEFEDERKMFQAIMSKVDENAPGSLGWLFQQFGILGKVEEMIKP